MASSGYRILFTAYGKRTAKNCAKYLKTQVGGNGNAQAAIHFEQELGRALDILHVGASGYATLDNPRFRIKDFRKIHFQKMRYKIVFHIKDDVVYIDAVFHDLQDYENILGTID